MNEDVSPMFNDGFFSAMLVYQRVRDELTGDVEIFVEANVLQLGKKNND